MSNQSDSLRVGGADRDLTRFVVTFDAPMRNLAQVSRTLSALDELWCVAVESTLIERSLANPRSYPFPYPWLFQYRLPDDVPLRERLDSIPRPDRVKVSLASPLWVELAGTLSWPVVMVTSAGLLRFLIKNADAVGSALPRLFESWFNGWADAYEARERWRARGLPSPRTLDDLAVTGQEAGSAIADAQPGEIEVTGPGDPWTPPGKETSSSEVLRGRGPIERLLHTSLRPVVDAADERRCGRPQGDRVRRGAPRPVQHLQQRGARRVHPVGACYPGRDDRRPW